MDFDAIWHEYRIHLTSFLHSKISNPDDVEDVLQDVLFKIYQNLKNLRTEDRLKPWLFQIANHAIIDFYRKRARLNQLDETTFKEEYTLFDEEGDVSAQQKLSHCIEPFIRALDPETSKLLHAIDLEGISQKEYAKQNQMAYSTLKSRVQKGRKELYNLFSKCCSFTKDMHGNIMDFEEKSPSCKKLC